MGAKHKGWVTAPGLGKRAQKWVQGHQAPKEMAMQKFRGHPTPTPKRRLMVFLDKFGMHTILLSPLNRHFNMDMLPARHKVK